MSATYDGPGLYRVELQRDGTAEWEGTADSREDAIQKAKDDAMDLDFDYDTCSSVVSVKPGVDEDSVRANLTPLEEAAFMLTSAIPEEATARINAEHMATVEAES